VMASLAQTIAAGTPIVACAKGIEHGTQKFHDRDYRGIGAPNCRAGDIVGPEFLPPTWGAPACRPR